jgi:ABC-2 family transporter
MIEVSSRAPSPTGTAATMFTRELLRRWPTLVFMIFMPLSYFVVSYLTSDGTTRVPVDLFDQSSGPALTVLDRDFKALYLAVLGISVTSSFAALTSVLDSTAVMRRLRLIGFRSGQLLCARLIVLGIITVVSTAVFLAVFAPLVHLESLPLAAAGLLLVGLLGVALGTVIGLLVPRLFEAAMLLIAVAGIQMALGRGGSDAERYLPYWPTVEALKRASVDPTGAGRYLLLAIAYILGLLILAAIVWKLRTRVYSPPRPNAGPDRSTHPADPPDGSIEVTTSAKPTPT